MIIIRENPQFLSRGGKRSSSKNSQIQFKAGSKHDLLYLLLYSGREQIYTPHRLVLSENYSAFAFSLCFLTLASENIK